MIRAPQSTKPPPVAHKKVHNIHIPGGYVNQAYDHDTGMAAAERGEGRQILQFDYAYTYV